ncbi:MAG: metal-dependent hydrolase [Bacillota bacterium]
MDNLTHGITGLGLAYLAQEIVGSPQPGLAACAFISSQLPDLDVIIGSRGKTEYLKHHRGFSHSLLVAPLFAFAVALGFKSFITDTSLVLFFIVSLLSLGLHLFFDLLNAYGTKLLWPLSNKRYAWDILMIIDPLIIIFFVLGLGFYLLEGQRAPLFSLYPLLTLYILAMVNFRQKAKGYLIRKFPGNNNVCLLPPMVGWRKWNYIVQQGEMFILGQVDAYQGDIKVKEELCREKECKMVVSTKGDPAVQVFLEFARFPWFSKSENGNEVVVKWSDLRYKLREKDHFALESKILPKH